MREPRQIFAHNIRSYQLAFNLSRPAFAKKVNEIIETLNIGCEFIGAKDVESYDSRESMPRDFRVTIAIIELFNKALPQSDKITFFVTDFSHKDFNPECEPKPTVHRCLKREHEPFILPMSFSGEWSEELSQKDSPLSSKLNSLTKEEQNYIFQLTSAMYDIETPLRSPNGEEENYTYKAMDINIAIKYIDGQKVEIAVTPDNDDVKSPLQIYSFEWKDYAKEIVDNDLEFFLCMQANRIFPEFLSHLLASGGINRRDACYEYEDDYDKFYVSSVDLEINHDDHLAILKFNLDNCYRRLEEAKKNLEQVKLEEFNSLKKEQLDP